MGLRFRRSVKLLPGVRLNFSSSGVTTSIGPRGARITLGGKKTRVTTGIPGTGLSYTTLLPNGDHHRQIPRPFQSRAPLGWGFLFCCVVALGFCGKHSDNPRRTPPASVTSLAPAPAVEIEPSTLRFVAVDALNVRDAANGNIVGSMARGVRADVYETTGGWSRISTRGAPPRWVSSSRLCAGEGCYGSLVKPAATTAPAAVAAAAPKVAPAPARRSTATSSSWCPCSSSSNCIGPRGGRYCITSGGNKRYR